MKKPDRYNPQFVDPTAFYGQQIVAASFEQDKLMLLLSSGTRLEIWDDGQSCCEARYLRTDDDVTELIGKPLTLVEERDGPVEEDPHGEVHEVQFLHVSAGDTTVVFSCHNEHNGYYGGICLVCKGEQQ